MSDKTLKRYQETAVNELLYKTRLLLDKDIDKRTIVFQSPTGSGKTYSMSRYIYQLIEDFEDDDFCFLWISIGKGSLHEQSYNSLKSEFNGFPDVYLLEQEFFGARSEITKNEVVVVNWEKLRTKDSKTGEWKNILMKDKETTNFRELIKNTKEDNTKIIMIIDESHSNATSERALELRDKIVNADLTIEMSATPVLHEGEYNEKVIVQPNDVIDEGMIKKEIIINENIDQIDDDEITSQELIMIAAFQKREELKQLYKNINCDINPLVLVQLPSGEAGEDKKEFIETFLADRNITYDNNKLAVWLSEEKVNNESEFVIPNNSEVDFLIFKQAIDTGWDCPRSSILVRFREIKSIVFEIQTIGRILRMPEALHYDDNNLNKGYVYTNVKSLEVKRETYNPNIIKSVVVIRKDIYKSLNLKSYYRNRVDMGDITLSFYKVLEEIFCNNFRIKVSESEFFDNNKKKVAENINLEDLDSQDEIILNKTLDSKLFDRLPEDKITGKESSLFSEPTLLKAHLSQDDLFHAFELLIKVNLNGFAIKRSIPTVKQALYRWFRKYLGINLVGNGIIYIQNIVLNNAEYFSKLFDQAIRSYKPIKDEEVYKKIEEIEQWNENWEISDNRNLNPFTYTESYQRKDNKHHVYFDSFKLNIASPCRLNIDSDIEVDFIKYLEDKADIVQWWWQNGSEHMSLNFGIKYNKISTFQPDFIVLLKNGNLGIFDTKASGYNEDDNKPKAEALQNYIKAEKKNIYGGLIIKEGQHFRINNKKKYASFKETPDDWEYFDEWIKSS